MKILLDECVPKKVKRLLSSYEVLTVTDLNFNGLKNGKLLKSAQETGFDLLLTIDKNIDSQQNISRFDFILVVLDVYRSNVKYIEPLIPKLLERLDSYEKGSVYIIS